MSNDDLARAEGFEFVGEDPVRHDVFHDDWRADFKPPDRLPLYVWAWYWLPDRARIPFAFVLAVVVLVGLTLGASALGYYLGNLHGIK